MEFKKNKKRTESYKHLKSAITLYEAATKDQEIHFLALTKAFEVLTEYSWKGMKQLVEEEGLEVFSPKDAVRQCARMGLIDEPDRWIECINARNNSVHDYFGISNEEFLTLAKELLRISKPLIM